MRSLQKNLALAGMIFAMTCSFALGATHWTEPYNVVWNSPSHDTSGTMPLGNGDIGINVWVEEDGDLLFLIGKSDAWDENSINCKLARVRVRLTPNPFAKGNPFQQMLILRKGEVSIIAGPTKATVKFLVWVDANQPVIRLESESGQRFTEEVILETWRNEEHTVPAEASDLFKSLNGTDPYPTIVFPDVVMTNQVDRLLCYHQNRKPLNDGYEINLHLQGMDSYTNQIPHPLLNRIFGAAITGMDMVAVDERTLKSRQPARHHLVSVFPLTLHPTTVEQWRNTLDSNIREIETKKLTAARRAHEEWWDQFWDRSWICIGTTNAEPVTGQHASTFEISRAYQLCRFMNACAGRGAQPIKFNGSLFSVGKTDNPDYRRWGGPGFWFQNQRLIYWPMLAAGDYDLMQPWFAMYRAALSFARSRTQKYFHHDGAFFGETIMFWGAEASRHYGWMPFAQRPSPLCESSYLTYYWQNNLENLAMMLDYFSYTGDEAFARETLMPQADEITKFYDLHYPRDAGGKIRFEPAQALETWHTAVNPLPEIVALKSLMPRLLALPSALTTAEQPRRWQRLLDDAPPLPAGEKNGKKVLRPAESYSREKNMENPELYGVFPYRMFGVGKPDLQMARDTFAVRKNRQTFCWCQNDTEAALLGLTDEAREILSRRAASASHRSSLFPAFWESFYDWIPDVDHGGNLQLALQFMLLQCDGDKIYLLPAWPKDWDVSFKLHAPRNTTVECVYHAGRVEKLVVTPRSRTADVIAASHE